MNGFGGQMAVEDGPDTVRAPKMEAITVARAHGWFWRTLLASWGIYLEVVVVAVLVNVLALAGPLFAMIVIDRLVPNFAEQTLWWLAIGVATAFGFGFALNMLRSIFVDGAGSAASEHIGERLFQRILTARFAHRPNAEAVLAGMATDLDDVREMLSAAPVLALIDLPFVILFIAVIYALGGPVAFLPLAAAAVIVFFSLILQLFLMAPSSRIHESTRSRLGLAMETATSLETIKSVGLERHMLDRWQDCLREVMSASRLTKGLAAGFSNVSGTVTAFATFGVIGVGVYSVTEGSLTLGGLIAMSMLAASAMAPLDRVLAALVVFHRAGAAINSIDTLMHIPAERPAGQIFAGPKRINGGVAFQQVSFRYPGQESPALENVSFRIEPGEKVGLIGRIGSGKSTVARLLLSLYEAENGVVAMADTDIQSIDPSTLRAAIGSVPQDIHLFEGSVKDNIAVGMTGYDDDAIRRAAQIAGVDEFTSRHSLGYDMPVGERGHAISGGQRQAIAMARALLCDPALLLLDEPTSALDNTSEGRFRARLASAISDKTLLLITNRASMLELVDRLIVIDGGKIIADGAKQEVLDALQGGHIKPTSGAEL
ncbi:MAG: ATP-binding cassette domain-containing protein [Alphaproteobacteria bacterium]|nr:ATP-binding cassette domain-containing protein [Alphaproteobacteria bacterium]